MKLKLPESGFDAYKWHTGFALFPHITEANELVWLCKIEKRISPYSPMGLTYEYRLPAES